MGPSRHPGEHERMTEPQFIIKVDAKIRRAWLLPIANWCLKHALVDVRADGKSLGRAPLAEILDEGGNHE